MPGAVATPGARATVPAQCALTPGGGASLGSLGVLYLCVFCFVFVLFVDVVVIIVCVVLGFFLVLPCGSLGGLWGTRRDKKDNAEQHKFHRPVLGRWAGKGWGPSLGVP